MEITTKTIEHELTWFAPSPVDLPLRHVTLPDTVEAVMRGVERAVNGEGIEIDPDDFPIDDDED